MMRPIQIICSHFYFLLSLENRLCLRSDYVRSWFFMMLPTPLFESMLALLFFSHFYFFFSLYHRLCLRRDRFSSLLTLNFCGPSCSCLFYFLVSCCVLQNCTLDVNFVHEVEAIAGPLKLVIKSCCVLFTHKLLKLAHPSFLSSL